VVEKKGSKRRLRDRERERDAQRLSSNKPGFSLTLDSSGY
jgi:hypothetical protein